VPTFVIPMRKPRNLFLMGRSTSISEILFDLRAKILAKDLVFT